MQKEGKGVTSWQVVCSRAAREYASCSNRGSAPASVVQPALHPCSEKTVHCHEVDAAETFFSGKNSRLGIAPYANGATSISHHPS
ncbi:MAG: hypothetical protein V2G43_03460 [bacterium JZ-2024 1]